MVPANRQHIVANFAQDYLFANGETITAKFAATDVVHLLFLGNLIEGKGHADLLAGYRLLPGALRDRIRLHFAGAFDTPDESARFAALIAGDPSIRYHGVVSGEGKRELLALAHVLVLPTSLSEGQPISILEAYAAGCVVMTTPCGGIPDIFTDGVHGFAIAPGAPESIRDAIAAALAGHGELAAIARRNWETATTTYRTEAYTTRVVALIEAAGGGSHVPAGSGS